MPSRPVRLLAAAVPSAALLVAATVAPAAAAPRLPHVVSPLTTFAVSGEVAEILAVTPDGRTVLYTDSAAEELGAVDISDPRAPREIATLGVGGEPTSVAVTPDSRHALVVVDTSESFTDPSGVLLVVDLRGHAVVRSLDLGGQPDSIAISPDGRHAAVAIENQRDEEIEVEGVEGGLPQLPAGFLAVVDLGGRVDRWSVSPVALTGLPQAASPEDPEPEYVDINRSNVAAVTLQENNAVALVDLRRRAVVGSFTAGTVTRTDADTDAGDGVAVFDDPLTAPREPDAVQWTPSGNLVTADEGDLAAEPSGGRGWTVFAPDGRVLYTSGGSAERALADAGFYPDDRSDDKGAEFEGAEVTRFSGATLTFIGSERGDAVLGYASSDDRRPYLLAVLDTGDAPEGLVAIPQRGLLLTSNEGDGTISVFGLPRP